MRHESEFAKLVEQFINKEMSDKHNSPQNLYNALNKLVGVICGGNSYTLDLILRNNFAYLNAIIDVICADNNSNNVESCSNLRKYMEPCVYHVGDFTVPINDEVFRKIQNLFPKLKWELMDKVPGKYNSVRFTCEKPVTIDQQQQIAQIVENLVKFYHQS